MVIVSFCVLLFVVRPLVMCPFLHEQNTNKPPTTRWKFWDWVEEQFNDNDTSLTLGFTSLAPCKLVKVSGRGEVVKKQPESLGVYRSVDKSMC